MGVFREVFYHLSSLCLFSQETAKRAQREKLKLVGKQQLFQVLSLASCVVRPRQWAPQRPQPACSTCQNTCVRVMPCLKYGEVPPYLVFAPGMAIIGTGGTMLSLKAEHGLQNTWWGPPSHPSTKEGQTNTGSLQGPTSEAESFFFFWCYGETTCNDIIIYKCYNRWITRSKK